MTKFIPENVRSLLTFIVERSQNTHPVSLSEIDETDNTFYACYHDFAESETVNLSEKFTDFAVEIASFASPDDRSDVVKFFTELFPDVVQFEIQHIEALCLD